MIHIKGHKVQLVLHETMFTFIYEVEEISTGEKYIVKGVRIRGDHVGFHAQLKNEARILDKLCGEPNIILLVENCDDHNPPFIKLMYGGETLETFLAKSSPFSIKDKIKLAIQMVEAIESIHKHSIIHKDLSLKNILIHDKTFKLNIIDFGIASKFHETQDDHVIQGSPKYMSPEQTGRTKHSIDYRTDYYSFGIILFKMFTGKFPFHGETTDELMNHHVRSPIPKIGNYMQDVPRPLEKIIKKLLAKQPKKRYKNTKKILIDLQKALNPKKGLFAWIFKGKRFSFFFF